MSTQATERKPPPYAPYRSWKSLIDKLRGKRPLPSPFDSGFWNSLGFSGAMISVLRPTMVSLSLLDANFAPTERLDQLLDTSDHEMASAYKDMMDVGFPEWKHKLDIERVTNSQLAAYFAEVGATGETVPKCKSFFIGLATDAGLDVSQHLSTRSPSKTKKSQSKRGQQRQNEGSGHSTGERAPPAPPQPSHANGTGGTQFETNLPVASQSLMLWGLFRSLPVPGTVFDDTDREKWIKAAKAIFEVEYQPAESPIPNAASTTE